MEHPGFFERAGPLPLGDIVDATRAAPAPEMDLGLEITDVRPLDDAGPGHISFFDNTKYLDQFAATGAVACFAREQYKDRAPDGASVLVSDDPYRAFAIALTLFYPDARHSRIAQTEGRDGESHVHPTAMFEEDARVEPGAVIGAEARIGRGSVVAAGAVVGYRVHIGRDCYVGPNANLTHALVGDRVILHAGVAIGQDGFGFAMSPQGHLKVPQIGRVIIQDDVEIGANTTIDRGALRDTIIGEGTKIDNLVQIGHNVVTGRHCVIVAQTGISGSTELGDFAVLGGQVGVVGHVKIGAGAQIGAGSGVRGDVPPGTRWAGYPAKPARQWAREVAILKRLVEQSVGGGARQKTADSEQE
ncbi:MAG: UDP-3-O-(3-hydroxymyristoyl)glucosamine N-acyltransferase [Methyloligellaceae bacterium]